MAGKYRLLNGIPVFLLAGTILATATPAFAKGGEPKPTDELERPILLGVSGSSLEHAFVEDGTGSFDVFCYVGTLGSLVKDGADIFILSNNHVLAKENVPDRDPTDLGISGDSSLELLASPDGLEVIQPGLLDVKGPCGFLGDPANAVAYVNLNSWVPLSFEPSFDYDTDPPGKAPLNLVDAAIAQTDSSDVDAGGYILGIGTHSGTPVSLGLTEPVQKMGRTSKHTFGTIAAVDVTLIVAYDGGAARFEDQIDIVGNCDEPFSASGDSGSLILTVPDQSDRAPVGLLYAGGPDEEGVDHTFANPIGDVLDALSDVNSGNFSMVECGVDGEGAMGCNHSNATDSIPRCKGGGGGGGGGGNKPDNPGPPNNNSNVSVDPIGLAMAMDVKAFHGEDLLSIPGVMGHGVGADENGDPYILLYLRGESRRPVGQIIPSELDDVPVRAVGMGIIRAR